jgi:hypothetical protein
MAELTDAQILTMLQRHLRRILEEDEEDRTQSRKNRKDDEDLEDHVDAMAYMQHDCHRELAIGNYSRVTGGVARLLREQGIELNPDGSTYKALCCGMMKVMINYLEVDIRRTRLNYSLDDLPFPEYLHHVERNSKQ